VRVQIEAEEVELEKVNNELGDLETMIQPLEAQMKEMLALYRDSGAPSDKVAEFDALKLRYSALVAEFNGKLGAYRERVARYDERIDDFNAEVAAYNASITSGQAVGSSSGSVVSPGVRFRLRRR